MSGRQEVEELIEDWLEEARKYREAIIAANNRRGDRRWDGTAIRRLKIKAAMCEGHAHLLEGIINGESCSAGAKT